MTYTKKDDAFHNPQSVGLKQAAKKPDSAMRLDYYLKAGGIALGIVCGLLPLFTYLQQIGFNLAASTGATIVDPLDRSQRKTILTFQSFRAIAEAAAKESEDHVPSRSNGEGLPGFSETSAESEQSGNQKTEDKPFTLTHVENGMALIKDKSGYWLVEPGSELPDGSRFIKLNQANGSGTWQMTTSKGAIIDASN